jgi:hypothetical protein
LLVLAKPKLVAHKHALFFYVQAAILEKKEKI